MGLELLSKHKLMGFLMIEEDGAMRRRKPIVVIQGCFDDGWQLTCERKVPMIAEVAQTCQHSNAGLREYVSAGQSFPTLWCGPSSWGKGMPLFGVAT